MVNQNKSENATAFSEAQVSDDCNYSEATFKGDANFKGKVFECFADFSGTTFHGKVDFSGAVFHDGASFQGAQFICNGKDVLFENAVFLPSDNNDVDFSEALFGLPYERDFGEWRIGFEVVNGQFNLSRFKQNKTEPANRLRLEDIPTEGDLEDFLKPWDMGKHAEDIISSLTIFRDNPKKVSFANCRFGDMDLPDLSETEQQAITDKENKYIDQLFLRQESRDKAKERLSVFTDHYSNKEGASDLLNEDKKTSVAQILSRHLATDRMASLRKGKSGAVDFSCTQFCNQTSVDFSNTLFSNPGNAGFQSATFSNTGEVFFDSTTFNNAGGVTFHSATFSNAEWVKFDSATFSNAGAVDFRTTTFNNSEDVDFRTTTFNNAGDVDFYSVTFSNAGHVNFQSATFSNAGEVFFHSATFKPQKDLFLNKIIWIQNGRLDFSSAVFKETLNSKFNECLFLTGGEVVFKDTRFPEQGSLMFQRCYFSTKAVVNFTGAFFRHTTFEGGPIGWLKDKKPQAILKKRLGEKYATLPQAVRDRIEGLPKIPKFSLVFDDNTEVWWKDLTTESAKNLTFSNTAFHKSLFNGVTLSHIQLNASHWRENDGRSILNGEEKLFADGRTPSVVELKDIRDQYTQLKNNLEQQKAYQQAGHFHHGEQDIKQKIRLCERTSANQLDWILGGWYKWSSGYGEKPLQTLIATLILVSSLTLFNCATNGFMGAELSQPFLSGPVFFKTLVQSISPFSWKVIAEEGYITELNWWQYAEFFSGQVLLLGIQLPLLVMTVRRRFKR
jgi:hypothetical protein